MNIELQRKEIIHGSEAYQETVSLRDKLLRKPLGLEFDPKDLAKEVDSYHLAVYAEKELLACLVLLPLGNGVLKMRQVVTAAAWQGKGIGQELVKFSEAFAKEKRYTKIELHARMPAVPFYDKLCYQKEGNVFEEVGIPHQKMIKHLSK